MENRQQIERQKEILLSMAGNDDGITEKLPRVIEALKELVAEDKIVVNFNCNGFIGWKLK